MLKLQSSNYISVQLKLKGEEVVNMPVASGLALMEYLTKDSSARHVQITMANGDIKLVNKFEIQSVTPTAKKSGRYKTASELKMPELGDGYQERVYR